MKLFSIPHLFFTRETTILPRSKRAINVNIFSPNEALSYIKDKIRSREGFALATINLDHMVKLSRDDVFFKAYQEHTVVADGFPIVWLGHLMGADVVRTPGSDLVEPIMSLLEKENKSLALIGTTPAVLADVSEKMKKKFPGLRIVFTSAPSFKFEPQSEEALALMRRVEESRASICFLAFGAPKQEILAAEAKKVAPHVGFISIGASLDFISGLQVRAPLWAQRANIEWLWRLAHNPRRLFWRYAQCAYIFPILLIRAIHARAVQKQSATT